MRKKCLYILFIIVNWRGAAQSLPTDTLPAAAPVGIFVDGAHYKQVAARDVARELAAYPGLLHCDSIVKTGSGFTAYYSVRSRRVDSLSVVSVPAFPPNLSRRWMRILRRKGLGLLPMPLPDFRVYGQKVFNIDGRRVLVIKADNPHRQSAELLLAPARLDGRWTVQGKARLMLRNTFNRAETLQWDYEADARRRFFRYGHRFPYLFGSSWHNRLELLWDKTGDRLVMQAATVFGYETGRWHWGVGGTWLRNADTLQSRIRRFAVFSVAYGQGAGTGNFSAASEWGIGNGAFYVKPELYWRHWTKNPLIHTLTGFYATDSIWALTRTTDSYLKFLVPESYYVRGHLLLDEHFYFTRTGVSLYAWHRFYALFGRNFDAESLFLSGLGLENGSRAGRLRIEIGYPYAKSFSVDNEQLMFSVGYSLNW